jgi:intracellular sulfur oxidation DsrE/DsrF family protein
MKNSPNTVFRIVALAALCCLFSLAPALGSGYEALSGVSEAKAVFDVRSGSPKTTWIYLDLIHKTYKDKSIREVTDTPDFKIVFIGPAVKLISTDPQRFGEEDKPWLDKIAAIIPAMAADGITLEICMYAADLMGVKAESVFPEIIQVENGWISLIGYQNRGYSLVPAY